MHINKITTNHCPLKRSLTQIIPYQRPQTKSLRPLRPNKTNPLITYLIHKSHRHLKIKKQITYHTFIKHDRIPLYLNKQILRVTTFI